MATIAIVDNSLELLAAAGRALKQSGFEVRRYSCVVSLLEDRARAEAQLVVVAEGGSGLTAVDYLEVAALDEALSQVPVIVVSGDAKNKLECFRLGCGDFVLLPVDDVELFFRIGSMLRRSQMPSDGGGSRGNGFGGGGLAGSFSEVSLVDVLQMLSSAQKSGCLQMQAGAQSGSLWFKQGQVIHAAFYGDEPPGEQDVEPDSTGEEAFLNLLRAAQQGGSFNFANCQVDLVVPTIEKRTDHLLLAMASALDEEG